MRSNSVLGSCTSDSAATNGSTRLPLHRGNSGSLRIMRLIIRHTATMRADWVLATCSRQLGSCSIVRHEFQVCLRKCAMTTCSFLLPLPTNDCMQCSIALLLECAFQKLIPLTLPLKCIARCHSERSLLFALAVDFALQLTSSCMLPELFKDLPVRR
eukprot:6489615-Amphidinium_carterae.2